MVVFESSDIFKYHRNLISGPSDQHNHSDNFLLKFNRFRGHYYVTADSSFVTMVCSCAIDEKLVLLLNMLSLFALCPSPSVGGSGIMNHES